MIKDAYTTEECGLIEGLRAQLAESQEQLEGYRNQLAELVDAETWRDFPMQSRLFIVNKINHLISNDKDL